MNLCPPSAFIHYTTNHLSPKTCGSQLPRWRARLVAQARAGIYSSTPPILHADNCTLWVIWGLAT